ncbi:FMN-linked oxidoreductase [Xylaria arbuscula]|nr:FMN-linked oxidoreductase [Xylaria arbuscula]
MGWRRINTSEPSVLRMSIPKLKSSREAPLLYIFDHCKIFTKLHHISESSFGKMTSSRLFKPLRIGNIEVSHRIGMAPLTRLRSTKDRVPTPLMKEYYGQRASVPGTLLISEGTLVSQAACGTFPCAPGLWSREQVAAWRTITDEVHRKGSFIFAQIAAIGRVALPEVAKEEGITIVGPSAIPHEEGAPIPHALTIEEIKQSIQEFVIAAENAISAGFDGVEVHGANGYLLDQFIQDTSNQRDDEYGGSVENRSRYITELLTAVTKAIGPDRIGLRLSPWSSFQGMRMKDPIPQFTDVIRKADKLNLAYLHLTEARVDGAIDAQGDETLDFAYKLWNRAFLVAGGYTPALAKKAVDEEYPDKDIVIIIGRHFISNPDLVYKIKESLALTPYDRDTFYTDSHVGYVDYPFGAEYLASQAAAA